MVGVERTRVWQILIRVVTVGLMGKLAFRLRLRRSEGLIPEDPQSMLTVTFDHHVLPK